MENKKKKVKGKIPSTSWLRNNGRSGLDYLIRLRPELFSHMEQDNFSGKSLEETVKDAEKLEEKYGEIPNVSWLLKNKKYIERSMRKYPEAFSHIKQKKMHKTLKEHVIDAEKLEKQYGELPSKGWLCYNKKSAMAFRMRNNPEAFAHIKQKKTHRILEECVLDAEKLEKQYGELPGSGWLCRNKKSSINKQIINNPEAFSHIKQKKAYKTLKEHVLDAEKLEKRYGKLPFNFWLKNNKKLALSVQIIKYPEAFSHIKQENKSGTSVKEWVIISRDIISKNNNMLPTDKWLRNNKKCHGLRYCIVKNPESFKGIRQECERGGYQILGE